MIYPLTLHGAKTSKLNENLENVHLVSASATDSFCLFSGLSLCPALRNLDLVDILLQRDEGNTCVLQLKRCSSSCCQKQWLSGEGSPSPLMDPTPWQLWGIGASCWNIAAPEGSLNGLAWVNTRKHKRFFLRAACC